MQLLECLQRDTAVTRARLAGDAASLAALEEWVLDLIQDRMSFHVLETLLKVQRHPSKCCHIPARHSDTPESAVTSLPGTVIPVKVCQRPTRQCQTPQDTVIPLQVLSHPCKVHRTPLNAVISPQGTVTPLYILSHPLKHPSRCCHTPKGMLAPLKVQ